MPTLLSSSIDSVLLGIKVKGGVADSSCNTLQYLIWFLLLSCHCVTLSKGPYSWASVSLLITQWSSYSHPTNILLPYLHFLKFTEGWLVAKLWTRCWGFKSKRVVEGQGSVVPWQYDKCYDRGVSFIISKVLPDPNVYEIALMHLKIIASPNHKRQKC